MFGDVSEVLRRIEPDHVVLDVGGWACPFNRANWVIDAQPYESRGFYEKIGMAKSQGGEKERFSKNTWIQRDICDKEPWPFEDKFFDFSICSHTLEDIRDPLYVCAELIRVSKRGYIEVPSRVIESTRGQEHHKITGLSHHRWLVDIQDNHIQFTMKYHIIHTDFQLSFPSSYAKKLPVADTISYLFWEDNFTYSETQIHGAEEIYKELRDYIGKRYRYPKYRYLMRWTGRQLGRSVAIIKRRIAE